MNQRPQVVVAWSDAPTAIHARVRELTRAVTIIGVTGPVGSGKSALAAALSSCVLSSDHYLPDYDKVEYHRRDDPTLADLARLSSDLAMLAAGRTARIPIWSFKTHQREGEREVEPHAVIVCEGIHVLHEPVASVLDIRVYVDSPRDVRWARWEHIEAKGERGWGVPVARAFFDSVAEPTFDLWAKQLRERADIVVDNGVWRP